MPHRDPNTNSNRIAPARFLVKRPNATGATSNGTLGGGGGLPSLDVTHFGQSPIWKTDKWEYETLQRRR